MLNTKYWNSPKEKDQYGHTFDPKAVANLATIVEKTGAEIVISSSWKCLGLAELQQMWKDRKVPGKVIDITPNTISDEMLLNVNSDEMDLGACRGNEIKEWLSKHGREVSNYVIIDDLDDLLPEHNSHFVCTDPNVGITEWDAMKAIAILNAGPDKDFVTIIRELEMENKTAQKTL